MKVATTKSLDDLRVVLKDQQSSGQDPAYWVFDEVSENQWSNCTVLPAGSNGDEYHKTFGHYHLESTPVEVYKLIHGRGVFILQKKHLERGVLIPEIVDEVYIIQLSEGDEVKIKPEWGHTLVNLGSLPLVTFDDWRSGHTRADYEPIQKQHGMAYYLVEEDGQIKAVANPNYQNPPTPLWVSAAEFNSL